jgi:fibronectin type 3 domain-containing protein
MLTRRYLAIIKKVAAPVAVAVVAGLTPVCATTVWTNRNDNSRSGAVLNETVLNQSNVNQNTFGYLFTCAVDNTPTQPLYVPNVMVNGASHNVMYVGTANNSLYAFDADTGAQLKDVNYGTAPSLADMAPGCYDYPMAPVGITDTPVIDTTTNTMYFVTRNKIAGAFTIDLHAVDLGTFAEKFNGPELVTASPAAVASGGSFDPQYLDEHAALTLANGTVYISFCSAGDCGDYRGWIFGYQASNVSQQQFAFSDVNIPSANAPNYCYIDGDGNCVGTGNQGGIWMSANGFAVDPAGNVYLATGNGAYDGITNFGDSIMKMAPSATSLTVQDWFTPSNQATLAANDYDVGAVGVVLLPDGKLVGGCKDGRLFLVNPSNMGRYNASQDNVLEEFQATTAGMDAVRSTPVYYNSPANGLTLYLWPNNDGIKGFQYTGGLINTTAVAENSTVDGIYDSVLSISANGNAPGTGIVWASESNPNDDLFGDNTLYAFNADNLSVLYDSDQDAVRDDQIGSWVRFTPPTVANGKVYVPSTGGGGLGVAVFGLVAGQTPTPTALTATAGAKQVTLAWTASSGAASYTVYRSSLSGGEQAPALASGVATTAFTDAAVLAGTTYYYTVTAVGSSGTSAMSNEANATLPPSAPTGLTATGGDRYATLNWTAPPGTVQGYNIFEGTASGQESSLASVAATTYTDTGLTDGVTYYFTVAAYNVGGRGPVSNEASATPLAVPTNLTATGSNSEVTLAWTGTLGATSYAVYRSTTSGGEQAPALASGIATTTYTDLSAVNGTTYYYTVTATSSLGTSIMSNEASATPVPAPAAPTGLTATGGDGTVALNWTASPGASTYNLYRGTIAGGEGDIPFKTEIDSTLYVDIGLTNGVTYYYEVTAMNAVGEGRPSNEASATPSSGVTFQSGLQLLSFPYDYPGVGLDSLFGYTGVKLAVWNPATLTYAVTPTYPADAIRPGVGYWANLPQPVTVIAAGTLVSTSQPFNIQLAAGWNQIGDPFPVDVPVSSLTFNGGQTTYAQATTGNPPLIGNIYMYTYGTGTNSKIKMYQIVPSTESLNFLSGYWIWASSSTTMQVTYP